MINSHQLDHFKSSKAKHAVELESVIRAILLYWEQMQSANEIPQQFPRLGAIFSHAAIERVVTDSRYERTRFTKVLSVRAEYRRKYLHLVYGLMLEVERVSRLAEETRNLELHNLKLFIKFHAHPIFRRLGKKNLHRDDVVLSDNWTLVLRDVFHQLSEHFMVLYHYMKAESLLEDIRTIPILRALRANPEYQSCWRTNVMLLCWLDSLP